MLGTKLLPLSRVEFYNAVITLAAIYGASITSGSRTVERNAKVGGGTNSKHMQGYAFDLVCDDKADAERLVHSARACGFDAVNEKDHVHIEFDPKV